MPFSAAPEIEAPANFPCTATHARGRVPSTVISHPRSVATEAAQLQRQEQRKNSSHGTHRRRHCMARRRRADGIVLCGRPEVRAGAVDALHSTPADLVHARPLLVPVDGTRRGACHAQPLSKDTGRPQLTADHGCGWRPARPPQRKIDAR
jgi:hypothetical protein